MRARLATVVLAVIPLAFACKDNPSKLDAEFQRTTATGADPWSSTFAKKDEPGGGGGRLGGFDLEGALERIKESIDTPGPYESPKKSQDFDAEKPHWGVLGMEGGVIEREAFSLT